MPDGIVFCIPGPWDDRSDFIKALAGSSDGQAMAAGLVFTHAGLDKSCEWTFADFDPGMAEAFRVSLMPNEAPGMVERVERHQSVLYLIDTGLGPDTARKMIELSMSCLDAGGCGVKVEAAGKAFSDEKWRELSMISTAIHEQLVLHMVADADGFWSCGNHQLGFPDTFVETDDFKEAVDVARELERYQLYQTPDIRSGHTFSTEDGSTKWLLQHEAHPHHDDEHLDRSLGIWRLSKKS